MNELSTIVSLAKRRGFIFQSSEIYGGLASTYDYGPLGVEMRRNIKDSWWKAFVHGRQDIVGLDSAILMSPQVWDASGHTSAGFADLLVDCRSCRQRFRADHLWCVFVRTAEGKKRGIGLIATSAEEALNSFHVTAKNNSKGLEMDSGPVIISDIDDETKISCPACDATATLTKPRMFNLMLKTFLGPVEDEASQTYLRPETAQGIFVNFQNVLNSTRRKLPFGIAQIGKAFRNEITVGNFIFRTREFEQMEIEYFVKPGSDEEWQERWTQDCLNWFLSLGISKDNLHIRQHDKSELAHYAKATYDIEYKFPWGWGEIQGISNRTDYDLKAHSWASGNDLTYFDEETKKQITPFVIEPSSGIDRTLLAILFDAYREEESISADGKKDKRVVLKLDPSIAPVKVAVLPLSRNEKLAPKSMELLGMLQKRFVVQYDDAQSIGRRYRRQDEIGTPLCVTIDFQTVEEDDAVTIRNRDSMDQVRVPVSNLISEISNRLPY
ncbi:MAG: glycyl-tRNA synthetase [Chloroflexi bacterium]|nr:MAG: glycyl-tRNA synthetase [Chloroflexota bacterium]